MDRIVNWSVYGLIAKCGNGQSYHKSGNARAIDIALIVELRTKFDYQVDIYNVGSSLWGSHVSIR